MCFSRIILFFDGASRHNPQGPAGCGWVLKEMDCDGAERKVIATGNEYLGYNVSNNQAEYKGLHEALHYMSIHGIRCNKLYIRGDSEIVIKQLCRTYQVRSSNIIEYYNNVREMIDEVSCDVTYKHIGRHLNSLADELANDAIDENQW